MAEVEISYKGSNIATMNASGTKTLLTEAKYMEDDVTVVYTRPADPSGTKSISITQNGTTTEDVTAYASAQITANVPNTYAAADEGKVVDNGALVAQGSDTVTQNDTYDTTLISSLTVNVSGGGGMGGLDDVASNPNINPSQVSHMLYAMKNKDTTGGIKTWTADFSNTTESLLLSTGLFEIHGILLAPTGYGIGTNLAPGQSNINLLLFRNYDSTNQQFAGYWGWSSTMQNLLQHSYCAENTRQDTYVTQGLLRFDGGDIYYTGRYNKNRAYQIIYRGIEYTWLAWGVKA